MSSPSFDADSDVIVWNIVIDQGESFNASITLKDDDDLIDLTDKEIIMQVRRAPDASEKLLDLSRDKGIIVDDAEGKITITITDEETTAIAPGRYGYDILIRDEDDAKFWVRGALTINPTYSR